MIVGKLFKKLLLRQKSQIGIKENTKHWENGKKHPNETCEKMWNADESAHTFALTLIILIFNQKVAFSSLNFKINCGFA